MTQQRRPVPAQRRTLAAMALVVAALLAGCTGPGRAATGEATGGAPSTAATASGRMVIPAHARALFFGDSWTVGISADRGRGFPYVTSELLGWTPVIDGVNGTGFVHTWNADGELYPVRAAKIPASTQADVVVLEGGINDVDAGADLSHYKEAVLSTIDSLLRHVKDRRLILFGIPPYPLPLSDEAYEIDEAQREAAAERGVAYISPIEEEWITEDHVYDVIDPDTDHPSNAGHAYLAKRLAADIERLATVRR